jgi:uncharacterized ion transporter superfamily protein YfcC
MLKRRSFPGPIAILMLVIIFAAIATWILPAGQYNTLTNKENQGFTVHGPTGSAELAFTQNVLDSLKIRIPLSKFAAGDIRKPVSIPGTFVQQDRNPQGFIKILEAPLKGIIDSIDIILFILVIGGFMFVFNETGAIVKGIRYLSHRMLGREPVLIILLTFIFSFCGASYGMAEEALVFYPLLVPLFLAAGYDVIVPLAIIFGGTTIGGIAAFSNPFSTIIASNAAGINWMEGLPERLVLFVIVTAIWIFYILRYAAKIKKNPAASIATITDGELPAPYAIVQANEGEPVSLSAKTKLLLLLYLSTFLVMIGGVVFLKWWTLEMSALFLGSSIAVALITRISEKTFTAEFIKGAQSLLSVAFIVGVARGVTIILNEGHISDSILFYTAGLVNGIHPALFILLLLCFYFFFSLFISSSSGMAVLTMPIIGALAIIVHIPGREIVNSYMYGMGIMSFITPTGLILPSLALVNLSVKAWMRFITPVLLLLFLVCAAFLIGGIYL